MKLAQDGDSPTAPPRDTCCTGVGKPGGERGLAQQIRHLGWRIRQLRLGRGGMEPMAEGVPAPIDDQ
jgi:hypothetical protein